MAKKEDSPAKLAILHEWDLWAKEHPEAASASGSLGFFEHLKNRRPDLLLDFRASGEVEKSAFMVAGCAKSEELNVVNAKQKPRTEYH